MTVEYKVISLSMSPIIMLFQFRVTQSPGYLTTILPTFATFTLLQSSPICLLP